MNNHSNSAIVPPMSNPQIYSSPLNRTLLTSSPLEGEDEGGGKMTQDPTLTSFSIVIPAPGLRHTGAGHEPESSFKETQTYDWMPGQARPDVKFYFMQSGRR
jgi:hypothetical protein